MDAASLLEQLRRAGRTLAVAESFTGGRLLDALTNVSGASDVVRGGIVAYADDLKQTLVGVPDGLLRRYGAVSEPVAQALAEGVRVALGADYGLATTGIAGPTGATPSKPLGLSVVAVASAHTRRVDVCRHAGSRTEVKARAVAQALKLLEGLLRDEATI